MNKDEMSHFSCCYIGHTTELQEDNSPSHTHLNNELQVVEILIYSSEPDIESQQAEIALVLQPNTITSKPKTIIKILVNG